ncbi:MAG: gliding motility-associated C-terminal domain-containing protein [Spirosomataceae bacterium]
MWIKIWCLSIFILLFTGRTYAQVQLKLTLDADGKTYKVFAKSSASYTGTRALITTSQISIAVPHGVGNNRFIVENLTSGIPNMRWRLTDRVDAPVENPEKDYLFFNFINNQTPLILFDIAAGQEILLFSFTRKGNCIGKANIVEENNDAFWPPNSLNTNIGINFSVVGALGNAYRGNYDAPPVLKVTADKVNPCAGTKVNFTIQTSVPVPNARFEWYIDNVLQASATGQTFSYDLPKKDFNYSFTASVKMVIEGTTDCDDYTTRSKAYLDVKGSPMLDWLEKVENCSNLPTNLRVSTSPNADLKWEKNGSVVGANSETLQVTESGNYSITASLNGCENSLKPLNIIASNQTSSFKVDAGKDTTVLEGEALILQGKSDLGVVFEWTPNANMKNANTLNPTVYPTENTTYKLTAKDANGCPAEDEVSVKIFNKLLIPNGFTPNNDNENDTWVIRHVEQYPDCIVQVINRWGNTVYRSVSYPTPWDGRDSQGRLLDIGTYLYKIITAKKTYSGTVIILY